LILLIFLKRKWITSKDQDYSGLEKNTYQVLLNPISSVLVLGLFIGSFFFKNKPLEVEDLLILIILPATIYLLPKLTVKRIWILTFLLLVLTVIHFAGNYIGVTSYIARISAPFSYILLALLLLDFRFNKSFKKFFNKKWSKLVSAFIYLFIILIGFALIVNILGGVSLAAFIYESVLGATIFAAYTWVATKVFVNIVLLLLKDDTNQNIKTISSFKLAIRKQIRPFFSLVGFLFWVYQTLSVFNVIRYVRELLYNLMDKKWQIGELTISLGGIISFLFILMLTIIITRLIGGFFKDDWIKKSSLPKGSYGVISIVLRITVTTLGLYLAATAAGININQLGFVVGALSVGIGFGLQSIVLNFFAGIILAFERPILVGDIIRVDDELGTITEIGVRASRVKTFDGSHVIIPNGDLVSKKVINYTLSDDKRKTEIIFRTAIDADPIKVIEILTAVAEDHPDTLKYPEPVVYFLGFGDSSLDFSISYWAEIKHIKSARSAIALEAFAKLKAAGIKLPIPLKFQISKADEDDIIPRPS
jgi:small-conductance mechanosensitive channel